MCGTVIELGCSAWMLLLFGTAIGGVCSLFPVRYTFKVWCGRVGSCRYIYVGQHVMRGGYDLRVASFFQQSYDVLQQLADVARPVRYSAHNHYIALLTRHYENDDDTK